MKITFFLFFASTIPVFILLFVLEPSQLFQASIQNKKKINSKTNEDSEDADKDSVDEPVGTDLFLCKN